MYQFSVPHLESAFRLDIDQVVITGQATVQQGDRQALVFEVRLAEPGWWCRSCGCQGKPALHNMGCSLCLNPPVWRRLRVM